MTLTIIAIGGIVLLVSLLWYFRAGNLLLPRRSYAQGIQGVPLPSPSVSAGNRGEDVPLRVENIPNPVAEIAAKNRNPHLQLGRNFPIHDLESPAAPQIPLQTAISRHMEIRFSHSLYLNQVFHVNVRIGPEVGEMEALAEVGSKEFDKAPGDLEQLQFLADEAEPEIEVELRFAEGDFQIATAKKKRVLTKTGTTSFVFALKPLKADVCLLTVVVSYTGRSTVSEKVLERVTTTKTNSAGEKTETTELVRVNPASMTTLATEVKCVDLQVSVKSWLGRSARELDFLKKWLGAIITIVLISIALGTGRIESSDALVYLITGLAAGGTVPVIDTLAKPFAKPEEKKPRPVTP